MKKIFYTFSLLLGILTCLNEVNAQNVNIPDPNFKAALIAQGVDTNGDGEIQVGEAQGVDSVVVSNLGITDMTGIEAFTDLIYLRCSNNSIISLNVLNNMNLEDLYCSNNQLTNIDLSNNANLGVLSCSNNQLTNLDLSNNVNLSGLSCSNNQLTNLDLSNNVNLWSVGCDSCALTSIDLSGCQYLYYLRCVNNQLTSLDVFSTHLGGVNCSNNQLTSLNLYNNLYLDSLNCSNNQLTNLFLKNGWLTGNLKFENNPNLTHICADPFELVSIQELVQSYGMVNLYANSLCIYQPGGNYNTVSGKVFIDTDLNGCTVSDPVYPFILIAVNDGINTDYTCSNQSGNYLVYLDAGNYTFTPQISNPTYFTANSATISFPNNNNNIQTHDFCVTPTGIFPDVEIALTRKSVARPGFDAEYQIHFKNNGTTIANGDITLDFQGNKMTFLTASTTPTNQTANQLTWSYTNLLPFETRTITLTMNILPPPTNNFGNQLNFTANISLTGDVNPNDNTAILNQTLVGSYDPNDKTCLEGHLVNNSQIGEYLHYMIRFQNTGNYPAEFVVIVDTLDNTKYDLSSLQIIETSHEAHIDLHGKVLQFYFENIQLADSFSNEPESHGFVVYKIRTKNTLPQNSSVSNKAEIYFDYNLPIVTNLETTTFTNTVSIDDLAQVTRFKCYPNPAQSILTIETQRQANFVIFNGMGEAVKEVSVNREGKVDISGLPQGIYFLKIKEEANGVHFMKE